MQLDKIINELPLTSNSQTK